jgi:hypothetical protein
MYIACFFFFLTMLRLFRVLGHFVKRYLTLSNQSRLITSYPTIRKDVLSYQTERSVTHSNQKTIWNSKQKQMMLETNARTSSKRKWMVHPMILMQTREIQEVIILSLILLKSKLSYPSVALVGSSVMLKVFVLFENYN